MDRELKIADTVVVIPLDPIETPKINTLTNIESVTLINDSFDTVFLNGWKKDIIIELQKVFMQMLIAFFGTEMLICDDCNLHSLPPTTPSNLLEPVELAQLVALSLIHI